MKVTLGTFQTNVDINLAVLDVLESGRLSYGPYSQKLEQEFSEFCGHSYGVLSNSGTSSLVVALLAMKEKYGWDCNAEVIVPATTFVATYNAVIHAGLQPVLVDITPGRWDFNYDTVVNAYTDKTVAVMAVNLFGKPSQLRSIRKACRHLGLKMIEDSCEAVGATHHGEPVGFYGDISVFSFYMAHILTSGVGGIAITSDKELALLMRSYVNHGLSVSSLHPDDWDAGFLGRKFRFDRIGHSYRITELEAAIALQQFNALGWIVDARNVVAATYMTYLGNEINNGLIQVAEVGDWETSSWMMFPIVLNVHKKYVMMDVLREAGVEVRDMLPLVTQPCYEHNIHSPWVAEDFPVAQRLNKSGFYVGCHQDVTRDQVMHVTEVIKGVLHG